MQRSPSRKRRFTSEAFILPFSLPNFHVHTVTAYAILRMRGVPIGKRDYEGQLRTRSAQIIAPSDRKSRFSKIFPRKMRFFRSFFAALFGLFQPETLIPKREIHVFAKPCEPTAGHHKNRGVWKTALNPAV